MVVRHNQSKLPGIKYHLIEIVKCVFLVHNFRTNKDYMTSRYDPDSKPLKVFWFGTDVTRYLTCRNNLTASSYFFLTRSQTRQFSAQDIRTYFLMFSKIPRFKPVSKEEKTKPPSSPKQITMKAPPLPTGVPATISPVARRMVEQTRKTPPSTSAVPPPASFLVSKFDDHIVFNAALKLAALQVACFRFSETRLTLYMTLVRKGCDGNVLREFRSYLEAKVPGISDHLLEVLRDFARQYTWIASNSMSMRGLMPPRDTFESNDFSTLHGQRPVADVMFGFVDMYSR